MSARAISSRPAIHDCRAMSAASVRRSNATTECLSSPIRMRIFWARSHSTSTPSALQPASCGANRQTRTMRYTSTSGTIILSQPDPPHPAEQLSSLPALPRDEQGPVFAEPWQAQAFALAVKLSEEGHFTWKEWASTLAEELKSAADRGDPDD